MSYGVSLIKNRADFFWISSPIAWRLRRSPFICIFPKPQMPVAETSFSFQSLYFLANAGRGTTERGTRHDRTRDETQSNAGRDTIERRTRYDRTQDEIRSNAGGRSLKSSKIAGPTHYFRVFKIEYQILAQRSRSGDLRWPANRLLRL